MQSTPKLFRDLSKTVGASGVQLFITLITTPIMTRLYTPHDYAVFGILMTIATVITGVGMLSLPNAYPLEKVPQWQRRQLPAMLQLLALSALCATLIAALLLRFAMFEGVGWRTLAFVPILVITLGLRQLVIAVATARTQFGTIATTQITEPICSRGGAIALGASIGAHPAFILLAVAGGHLTSTAFLLKRLLHGHAIMLRARLAHALRAPLFPVLRHYRDFVWFQTAAAQTPAAMLLGMQLLMAVFLPQAAIGNYILATSILMLPIGVIAMTASSVIYRHFIELAHHQPAQLRASVLRWTRRYALLSLAVFAPLMLAGPWLFEIAFGAPWRLAGEMASVLSPALALLFVLTGIQPIFRVQRRLKLQLALELATGLLVIASLTLSLWLGGDLMQTMQVLMTSWSLRCLVILIGAAYVSQRPPGITAKATP
jgi:O-antigen/teichoic acid export membrane protein